jgi:hypothetical protein
MKRSNPFSKMPEYTDERYVGSINSVASLRSYYVTDAGKT